MVVFTKETNYTFALHDERVFFERGPSCLGCLFVTTKKSSKIERVSTLGSSQSRRQNVIYVMKLRYRVDAILKRFLCRVEFCRDKICILFSNNTTIA